MFKGIFLFKPATSGKWIDLSYISNGISFKNLVKTIVFLAPVRDSENEMEMQNFEPESEEEKELLGKIKSSFRCWQKKEDSHLEAKTAKSKLIQLLKLVGNILGLYLLNITIGPLIGQARNIAIYFEK